MQPYAYFPSSRHSRRPTACYCLRPRPGSRTVEGPDGVGQELPLRGVHDNRSERPGNQRQAVLQPPRRRRRRAVRPRRQGRSRKTRRRDRRAARLGGGRRRAAPGRGRGLCPPARVLDEVRREGPRHDQPAERHRQGLLRRAGAAVVAARNRRQDRDDRNLRFRLCPDAKARRRADPFPRRRRRQRAVELAPDSALR